MNQIEQVLETQNGISQLSAKPEKQGDTLNYTLLSTREL